MRDLIKLVESLNETLVDDDGVEDNENYINGYTVTIEPNEDREGVNCWIEMDGYSASLAAAEDMGVLYKGDAEKPISQRSLDEIRHWAESKGY